MSPVYNSGRRQKANSGHMRLYDIVITSLLGREAILWQKLEITFARNGSLCLETVHVCWRGLKFALIDGEVKVEMS